MERYGVEIVSGLRQCLSWTNERYVTVACIAIDYTCFCKNVQANGVSLHTFLARYAVAL